MTGNAGAPSLGAADGIVLTREGGLGRIVLDRPEALHALDSAMCLRMTSALLAWRDDPGIGAITITHHQGTRGFCAGGDIRMLAESGAGDGSAARAFFHAEYRLNHLIHAFPKPIVAVMDGITMGGGVGISVHAPIRIATERTVFAMPETGIGLFPDVGGGWFLPRLPEPELGTWLALTGERLKGQDVVAAGVATHFIPTEILDSALAQIAGAAMAHEPARALASGLAALDESSPRTLVPAPGALMALFGHQTVEAILDALEADSGEWATRTLATLRTRSPQTLKVALRQLRAGARMTSFAEVMAMEYRIGCRVVHRHDFLEGVRAVIVDKDNAPRWSPSTLEAVDEAMLEAIFAPLPPGQEWTPLDAAITPS